MPRKLFNTDGEKFCYFCGIFKPIEEFSKGKHAGNRCKQCKRDWNKKHRSKPEVKEKIKKYNQEIMKNPEMREKKREYNRKRNKRDYVKKDKNKRRRDWTLKEKIKAVLYKGGCCVICGYNRCTGALEFHHLDPSKKEGYGGGAICSHKSFEKNKEEIEKCILLCNRCHREIHLGVIKYEA